MVTKGLESMGLRFEEFKKEFNSVCEVLVGSKSSKRLKDFINLYNNHQKFKII